MNKLNILYEDNHIIVVVKERNILSQSDITGDDDMLSLIKDYIKEKYHKPGNVYLGLVHRLDRVVSGVMVFAKTSKAASRLSDMIRKGNINKHYLVVCHGKMNDSGIMEDKILKLDNGNSIIDKNGKDAKLSYKLLNYDNIHDLSLCSVLLETGRHHQIRVSFSSRGFPLVGDKRYGHDNYPNIGLHAYMLEFIHPVTKEEMIFKYIPYDIPFNYFKINL